MFTDAAIALMASLEYNRVLVYAHVDYNNVAVWVVRPSSSGINLFVRSHFPLTCVASCSLTRWMALRPRWSAIELPLLRPRMSLAGTTSVTSTAVGAELPVAAAVAPPALTPVTSMGPTPVVRAPAPRGLLAFTRPTRHTLRQRQYTSIGGHLRLVWLALNTHTTPFVLVTTTLLWRRWGARLPAHRRHQPRHATPRCRAHRHRFDRALS